MRIKSFEHYFINESFNENANIIKSFQEAEAELSKKKGIVLSGVPGDITDIEDVIERFAEAAEQETKNFEAYVLITKQDGPVANWKSDVFLVFAENLLHDLTHRIESTIKKFGGMTIEDYFKGRDDEEWIDPAGGTHYGNEDDPAKMYENEIRARGILESKEDLVAFMKALIRGEVAQIVSSQSNIKIILSDIGLDQVEKALDEIKTEVERLKKSS